MARRTGEGLDLRQSRSRKAPVVATAIRGEGDAIGWEGRLAEAPHSVPREALPWEARAE